MMLIDALLKLKKITAVQAEELKKEIKTSNTYEEEVILKQRIVPEDFLFQLKSQQLKIPLREVFPEDISLKVLELIPEDSVKYYRMVPINKRDSIVEVGMVSPDDIKAREALKFLARDAGFSYEVYLITLSNLEKILMQYKGLKKEVGEALGELEVERRPEKRIDAEVKRIAERAPISKIVSVMLRHAVEGGASDIHVEPTRTSLRVRYRMLGELHSSLTLPLKVHSAVVARIKILADLKIDETRVPQDGRFSVKMGGRSIDFRVSTFPTSEGEKAAIRILDPEKGFKSLEDVGLEGKNYEAMKDAITKPYGMILATGPTGSGKTTTLYAILRKLNREEVNVMTLEDPIEYHLEGVNQSQIRPDIGYTFAVGLRHIMRQDPDIIMVGEIRDEETAALAIHSALTGHLVLSSLHTNNAVGVIPRLVDMGVEPFLVPPTLNLALAQRLIRVLCPYCKKRIKLAKKNRDILLKEVEDMPEQIRKTVKVPSPLYLYQSQGCRKCGHTGYAGRLGIFEVLSMTPSLGQLILKTLSEVEIREEAKKQGRITIRQDGILKVLAGVTTMEEVIRVTK